MVAGDFAFIATETRTVVRVVAIEIAVIPTYNPARLARVRTAHVATVVGAGDDAVATPMAVTAPIFITVVSALAGERENRYRKKRGRAEGSKKR